MERTAKMQGMQLVRNFHLNILVAFQTFVYQIILSHQKMLNP